MNRYGPKARTLAWLLVPALLGGCWWDDNGNAAPPAAASYSVGGAITGLTTVGLVLINDTETVSLASGATSFNFPGMLAQGATYGVSVQTQPASANCSVTNGSGTVGTSNVSNVQVACADTTFTVGGSITGLTGTGLVLANGADTLTVAANATGFTLPTAVAQGAAYTVTVKTQPTGNQCSLTQSSGTIGSANVSNVAVACAALTHVLGGSISGLPSTGLVLANGSDTVSPAAGALSFAFTFPVAEGGAYAVSVKSQPTGASCSVGSSSGTMGTADVDTVQVTCAANAYKLGGTIAGLTTTGLILANGTDTVSPTANTTSFTFNNMVAFGGSYSVTVKQQPVTQTCTVAGTFPATMRSGDVTGVTVTCSGTTQLALLLAGRETCPAAGPIEIDGTGAGASMARLYNGQAFDAAGNLYVMSSNLTLRKVTPAGVVTTIAGQYYNGGNLTVTDGAGSAATFGSPAGLALDSAGNVYLADGYAIRKVTPAGVVTTIAGNAVFNGYADGTGTAARFAFPNALAVDTTGNIYVADANAIRKITPANVVTTYAGFVNLQGYSDGAVATAQFNGVRGLAFDAAGNLFVADSLNSLIRKITPAGIVSSFTGAVPLASGFADGTGTAARFGQPSAISIDSAGNLYVEDYVGSAVRLVTPAGIVTTIATTQLFTSNTGAMPPSGSISLPINYSNPSLFANASGSLFVPIGCAMEKTGP